jgi:SAM-dependent methyltransferase
MTNAPDRTGERVDSARLQDLALGYWKSAALMSAVDLGVFTAVSQGATDVDAIALATDLSPTNAERLVAVLRALDLIRERDDRLENTTDVERFLVEGGRDYAGEERVLGMYETLDVEAAREYHRATWSIGVGAGRRFARQVDLGERRRILDLGGGSGAYSIVAAQTHPHLEAVVFDLPPVAEVAREFIERAGVGDRVRAVAGDFTRDPFPSGADVVIMASNLPQYSGEIIRDVIRKAFDALEPGGEMHLIGETLDDDRSGPIGPALWGLAETLFHSTGKAHTEAECIASFRAAGFTNVAATPFVRGTLTRIHGTRPR